MKKLMTLIAATLLFFQGMPVLAGKLGVCKRCVTDSGIEAHMWTRDHISTLGFCASFGMNDGGDGNPTSCDAQAGIVRWKGTNDPFSKCSTNASNHSAWIGGERDDLIVLSPDASNLNDPKAEFFRVQDGDGYRCRLDFASGTNFSTLKYGENRDLINIYIQGGDNVFTLKIRDRLQNGKFHALEVGENFSAVLYGNNKDILRLYGIKPNGQIVVQAHFVNDGRNHILQKLSKTDAGLIYGRNKDIRVRYCFTGEKWRYGYLGIGQPFAKSCNKDLNWDGYTRALSQQIILERNQ